jgi:pilus assembly protein CpaC
MVAKKTNRRVCLYVAWALFLSSAGRLVAQEEYPQPPTPSTPAAVAPASAPNTSPEGEKGSGTQVPWVFNKLPNSASSAQAAPPGPAQAPAAESNGASQTLHLVVGRSLFITTSNRLRRVYVSNPKVLDSLIASPRELVISAKATGTSSVAVWSETGESTVYTVCADVDVTGLRNALAEALPDDQIEVESQQGRVFLSGIAGADAEAEAAGKLASVYSKDVINSIVVDPRHGPQIQLKIEIAEVDRNKLDQFGINIFSIGKNTSLSTTGQFSAPVFNQIGGSQGGATATLSDVLNLFYFNTDLNLGVTLKDLQNKGVLEILAEPTLTTINGQPAKFLAGGEFPYPVVQPSGGGGVTSVTILFKQYGIKLDFTPFVNPDGTIRLKVTPEVSALDYQNQVIIAGYVLPAISTRKAETEIELRDGQSFGISGLLDRRTTEQLSKVPGIGDIPILGQLFRSRNLNHSVTELIVIATPTIVDPLKGPVKPPAQPNWVTPPGQLGNFDHGLPK